MGVFSLTGWSRQIHTRFLVSRATWEQTKRALRFSVTGLSPSLTGLSRPFHYHTKFFRADPRSLAATVGISIDFFSSGYLDVSVPRVRLLHLCIQCKIPVKGGFPHSEISGSKSVCRLPEAYRRLLRPSSPLAAKASTVYAYSLDYITQNSHFQLAFRQTLHHRPGHSS